MNRIALAATAAILLLSQFPAAFAQISGSVVAWGRDEFHGNEYGQCNVPAPNADFAAIAASGTHSLGLKSDGRIVAWGNNGNGQCNVPAPNTDFVAVAGGDDHSLGLKSDGRIVAWGDNGNGQCNVPAPNADFEAVAAGKLGNHSLGLKTDGRIVAWGANWNGQCNVPPPNADFVAMDGGVAHSLGLKRDGSVVCWGWNNHGQLNVPAPNADFVAIAAGAYFCLGLKSDGRIVGWGQNYVNGPLNIPEPNADWIDMDGIGWGNAIGLKSDGTVLVWGGEWPPVNIPEPNTGFVAVAGGAFHCLGLRMGATAVDYTTVGPATRSAALAPVAPNPVRPPAMIEYRLAAAGPVRLRIYDVGGRLVRTLVDGQEPAADHRKTWNGRDDAGRLVPSGVYFYRLEAGGQSATQRLVMVR